MSTTTSAGQMNFTTQGARRAVPWTQLHDWVRISGISPIAASLYWVIKMHVYVRSGDNSVTTTADTLASFCGLSRGDKVVRYIRELEGIGAISSKLAGMPARKVYVVHEEPPEDYTGPLTLKDWYEMRKAVRAFKAASEESAKPQVSTVAPSGGEQQEAPSGPDAKPQVSPVAPSGGEQPLLPPGGGSPVDPSRGHKQEAVLEQGASSTSSPASAPAAQTKTEEEEEPNPNEPKTKKPDPASPGEQLTEWEQGLVSECLTLRPDWAPSRLRAVIADPDIRDRPDRDLVRRAFLLAAETPRTVPGRMLATGCPHWADAAAAMRKEARAAAPAPARTAVPSQAVAPVEPARAMDNAELAKFKAQQAERRKSQTVGARS